MIEYVESDVLVRVQTVVPWCKKCRVKYESTGVMKGSSPNSKYEHVCPACEDVVWLEYMGYKLLEEIVKEENSDP